VSVDDDSVALVRPGAVSIAVGIIGFVAISSMVVALLSLFAPQVFPERLERLPLAPTASLAYLAASVLGGVLLYWARKGFSAARWALLALATVSLVSAIASGSAVGGTVLVYLSVVMLFLTESNAWFSAKKAERAAA
jgi:hypothetical protein